MSRRKPTVCYDASSCFIDPANCDSTIGYRIVRHCYGRYGAIVALADCNRKIEWDFGGNSRDDLSKALKKVDMAIAMLHAFRERLIRHHPTRRRK